MNINILRAFCKYCKQTQGKCSCESYMKNHHKKTEFREIHRKYVLKMLCYYQEEKIRRMKLLLDNSKTAIYKKNSPTLKYLLKFNHDRIKFYFRILKKHYNT